MKIAILGAGAMGSLFGGYLSKHNEVYLIDVVSKVTDVINDKGVTIREKDGSESVFFPKAFTDGKALPVMDLVIVFVKAMYTCSALENNRNIIGKDTYLMTLQNGSGHERKFQGFADDQHIIIGATQHNSSILDYGKINHGGCGKTSIGLLSGKNVFVETLSENLTSCGFECCVSDNIQKQIWNKMFLNTAASSLTGLFQVSLGFILDNPNAYFLMEHLAKEAVDVANAKGLGFDFDQVFGEIKNVLEHSKAGFTSIYADLRAGRKSEVDTISGSVVATAKDFGIEVPYHEFVVNAIHAIEAKNKEEQGR